MGGALAVQAKMLSCCRGAKTEVKMGITLLHTQENNCLLGDTTCTHLAEHLRDSPGALVWKHLHIRVTVKYASECRVMTSVYDGAQV
mgnify:CR=1